MVSTLLLLQEPEWKGIKGQHHDGNRGHHPRVHNHRVNHNQEGNSSDPVTLAWKSPDRVCCAQKPRNNNKTNSTPTGCHWCGEHMVLHGLWGGVHHV